MIRFPVVALTISVCLVVLLFTAGEASVLPSCSNSTSSTLCTITFYDGSKYVGEWKGNRRHGQGSVTYTDGSKYVGEWRNNKRHGQGTFTHFDGSKYVGEWLFDKFHGQGTYTYANGIVHEGIFKNGEFQQLREVEREAEIRELKPRAKQGDADAQFKLGLIYEKAAGVLQNDNPKVKERCKKADRTFECEVERHNRERIAREKQEQERKKQEHERNAFYSYERASKQGHADAQFKLGLMYEDGKGVPQSDRSAKNWYKRTAKQGHADAKEAADRIAREERIAREKREQERIAREKREQERIAKEKREQERIAKEKREQERIAREKREQERIAREKREQERIAQERIAREKREQERIAREKQSASNPGFRDLRPGLHRSTIAAMNVCGTGIREKKWTTCYGIDNLKFIAQYDNNSYLIKLTVDLGPIVEVEGDVSLVDKFLKRDEKNILYKTMYALGNKYELDFEFSERDIQLFNEEEKSSLYTVYAKGQVALVIWRKQKNSPLNPDGSYTYSLDPWLYIEYRDVKYGKMFLEKKRPVRAQESDF